MPPALSAPPAAGGAAAADVEWAPGRLLLVPRAGFGDAKLDRLLAGWGARQRRVGASELRLVTLGARGGEAAVAAALARHPGIKFAELDRRVAAAHVANDPYAGSQWHLGQIGAGAAWDLSQGSGVTIAILDSGVDTTHPDLAAQAVPGWNLLDNNADTADVNGHGTAVAGAALAVLDNAVGVAGLAGHARLMPVRIADANAYAYWSTVAQGLVWAADHGARVANISYVGLAASQSVQNAAQYLRGKGGLVVVCAGNNAVDEQIAPTTTMIPVSATDANDALTSFSSWGQFVALAAPGMNVWTTVRGTGYQAWWGTSMASPIVAGVAGLMMAAKPTLANTQIESLLYATAADLGAAGRDPYFGYGRVDAARAVQAAAAATSTADTQAPSAAIGAPASGATVAGVVAVDVAASDNVGVVRVDLLVDGKVVASDGASPFAFAWDSTMHANGSATLVAAAVDAVGNRATSAAVAVGVVNAAVVDSTPPVVQIVNPGAGRVSGVVKVAASASDDSGAAALRQSLYIDGALVASASGGSLGYSWNTRKAKAGTHVLKVVATDAAGNVGTASVEVTR